MTAARLMRRSRSEGEGWNALMRVVAADAYGNADGGAQRTVLEIAGGLPDATCCVVSVSEGPLTQRARRAGLQVEVIDVPATLRRYRGALVAYGVVGRAGTLAALVRSNLAASRRLRSNRADLLYCANLRAVLVFGAGARLVGCPVVWHVQLLEGTSGRAQRVAARLATRIVTISSRHQPVSDGFRRRDHRKIRVVPLSIAPPAESAVPLADRDLELLFVGEISIAKGVGDLCEAFATVVAQRPGTTLDLVGAQPADAPEAGAVVAALSARLPADVLRVHGYRDDAGELMRRARVVVLPSFREGVPRVLMEAQRAGAVVVASDVGAVRDLIVHLETGMLVEPGRPDELAAVLLRCLTDDELASRLAANGFERARKRSTPAEILAELRSVFAEAVGG